MGRDNWTALEISAQLGLLEVVQSLIKHPKTDLHIETPRGSALHLGAKAGNFKICQFLLLEDPSLLTIKDSEG